MPLTPEQARARLAAAKRKLALPVRLAQGRESFDVDAMRTMAIADIISFLEDALA